MADEIRFRAGVIEKTARPGADGFDARFIMSAATVDRDKDTIDPKAYGPTIKRRKILALFNHDPDRPIGYWANMQGVDDTLTGYIKLAGTNLGQMLKALLDDDVPLGASIAFRGGGKPNSMGGVHFDAMDIFECSIVAIPAHPRAQRIAKSFGIDLSSKSGLYVPAPVSGLKAASIAKARKALARVENLKPQR